LQKTVQVVPVNNAGTAKSIKNIFSVPKTKADTFTVEGYNRRLFGWIQTKRKVQQQSSTHD
jgi:hypothetical protein